MFISISVKGLIIMVIVLEFLTTVVTIGFLQLSSQQMMILHGSDVNLDLMQVSS